MDDLLDFDSKEGKLDQGGPISKVAFIELVTICLSFCLGFSEFLNPTGMFNVFAVGQIFALVLMRQLGRKRWLHLMGIGISISGWLLFILLNSIITNGDSFDRVSLAYLSGILIIIGFVLEALLDSNGFKFIWISLLKLGYVLSFFVPFLLILETVLRSHEELCFWIGLVLAGASFLLALILNGKQQSAFLANRVIRIMALAFLYAAALAS